MPVSDTSRVPGCSSQRSTHSVSSADAAGVGPWAGSTTSAVDTSEVGHDAWVLGPAGNRGPGQPAVADHDDLPGAVVALPGGDHLRTAGERGQPLQPSGGPHERRQPVAVHGGLLVALVLGEPGDLAA